MRPAARQASGREWGLDGLAETAELLVSELATNAVQAMARQGARQPSVYSCSVTMRESASRSGMPTRRRRLPETPERTAYPTSKGREGVGWSW